MKKLLLIGGILLSCLFSFNVKAEEIVNNPVSGGDEIEYAEDYHILLSAIERTKWNIEHYNSYFKEGEDPKLGFLFNHFIFGDYYEDFITDTVREEEQDEWGSMTKVTTTYLVPADIFEVNIKQVFNISENLLNAIRSKYVDEGVIYSDGLIEQNGQNYYSFYTVTYEGAYGGAMDTVEFLGYKELGNNIYEAYSYLSGSSGKYNEETGEWEEYKPSKDEQYKKDYMVECYKYEDEYDCSAVRIESFIKVKVNLTENGIKYLSYEKINYNEVPNSENLIKEIDAPAIDEKTEDASISAPEGAFIDGTKITLEKQIKGTIYDAASKVLKDKFKNFVIFEINAKAGDYDVEPSKKVTITINVPEGYKNPVIYYVTEDGKLEKIDTKVKDGKATAELSHFSTYALVDETVTVVEKVEQTVDKVVESVVENPKLGAASALGAIALALGGTLIYLNIKKKNKFPQA